ncbi:UDP-N-acetylmuramoyl-L-alanine--D-glutamate ligase [Candidatus Saccharibacteria bacterium]|nr:UDP-N-acetylmuramoyl-L-alanine--D-glutamate ligase [Candidatus Saccharibacteria bacterium]
MKIAVLGYGKEGKAVGRYFSRRDDEIKIFDKFTLEELKGVDFSEYDMVFRSPSVHPRKEFTSVTRYFFEKCPAPIIGVTGTKGKGTTCSLITAILQAIGKKVYLVGNIGKPAIDVLDDLTANDVVVYEMSSFQLWDLERSPRVAVVLRIEADHLNVHDGFDDYVEAKANIARHQTTSDTLVYFKNNKWSVKVAEESSAHKLAYPLDDMSEKMRKLLDSLGVPGEHNKENAEAALLAVSGFLCLPVEDIVSDYYEEIAEAFKDFKGLPHHIEYVRTLNGVDYYDDSFSASYPSLDVAIKTFADRPLVLIAGGKDRGLNLTMEKRAIFDAPNLVKVILIGETRQKLAEGEDAEKYLLSNSLEKAVVSARDVAERLESDARQGRTLQDANGERHEASNGVGPVVLLSPGAASFDMFKDFYERGDKFKELVKELK